MPARSLHRIVALVGMCGAGKSEAADKFIAHGYQYIRFGQITLDEIKKRGLEVKEENEKMVRDGFRTQHGMAAFAILNIPKIEELLNTSHVIADGLYSWSEYKVLKEKYGEALLVIAIYASAQTRYPRLEERSKKYKDDPHVKYRSFARAEAHSRDYAEIERSEKGGPIAMADYTIVNEGTLEEFRANVLALLEKIQQS